MKPFSIEKAIKTQDELSLHIIQEDRRFIEDIHLVAGVDLAYWTEEDGEHAVCCIVVLENGMVVEKKHAHEKVDVPYIPGCLAFRELPLILETTKLLETRPDLYMFDGNGILHPRNMGIASHASFYLDCPTMGVAKNLYKFDCLKYTMPENEAFAHTDIKCGRQVIGRTLRTHKDVKPVYVSVGNYITLDTATTMACVLTDDESHVPVPTRLADLETHKWRKELKKRG